MPAELLLVGNPARRRRRAKSRKAASPAQRRARAAFAARARAHTLSNPVKRHRRRSVARTHRRVRRNPIGGSALRGLGPMLKSAAYGAAGAVAVDVGYGFALPYLPAMIQSPISATGINPAYYLGKGAFAVALGMLGKRVLGAKAAPMIEGSLAVLMHDAAKQFIGSTGMAIPMGYMPGGRIVPQLPAARSLRMYTGGGNGRASMLPNNAAGNPMLGMYTGPQRNTAAAREGFGR